MDHGWQLILSNTAFTATSMAAFLFFRHRMFIANAFKTSISPLCWALLRYESRTSIATHQSYLRRLAVYALLQSALVLAENKYPKFLNLDLKQKGKEKENGYRISASKLASPLLFCFIFRLPIWLGLGLGLTANHISANELDKLKEMLQ